MGLFDSWKRPPAEETLDALVERARAGDTQGALAATQGALAAGNEKLARAEKREGAGSPAYAAALFEHATLCLVLGMVPRAVASMRAASEIHGRTRDDEKNRLTYLMNLGDALAYAGELEEALAVHERGLAERERFYGKEHPGYAFGLDSWATVAIALGRWEPALKAAQQALAIYDEAGHERVVHAWALLFLAGAGMKARWTELRVSPEMAHAILDQLRGRSLPVAAAAELSAVETLAPLARDEDRVLQAWASVERRAQETGDQVTRIAALERLRALAQGMNDHAVVLQAELGIALAHDKAGDAAAATRGYDRAIAFARAHASPEDLVMTLRNAGLYFVRLDAHRERGMALLREAVAAAPGPGEQRARSGIALGIQLQHRGELAEARDRLVGALAEIDPAHPDAMCGRSHLRAIDEKQSCGCGDVGGEVHAQIERIVRGRLPAGLLDRIDFDGANVGIHVTRELTEDEARLVADAVELAMSEMRTRIRATYGA